MIRYIPYPVALCLSLLSSLQLHAEKVDFNKDIRPILSDRCFHCHGPDEEHRKGHLRLDITTGEDGAYRTYKGSQAITPGQPQNSEVWQRIITDDEDDIMPPIDSHKKTFTKKEKGLVKRWIEEGAEYLDFWAFVTPQKSEISISNTEWPENPIDHYVLAKLEKEGLDPSPEADKRTLLRRLSFDLTGLPPTLKDIEPFLNDPSAEAYENLVDKLLARSSYGEHMARYWADLVRLADTSGIHRDHNRSFSTYRDWLIQSFNGNMPYSDFLKYQLAGDLFEKPTQDQLIASGFNRLHLTIVQGTALPEESLHKNTLDRVTAFGTAFLGLTLQCAQCHDHKYDPITQKEFYQFYAFFNNFSGNPESLKPLNSRHLEKPFINIMTNDQQNVMRELEKALVQAEKDFNRKASLLRKGFKDSDLTQTTSPYIWAPKTIDQTKVELQKTFTMNELPDWAALRFNSQGKVQVFLNDQLIKGHASSSLGVLADIVDKIKVGQNTLKAIATKGKGKHHGFSLALDYQKGQHKKIIKTSQDWEVKGKDAKWLPAKIVSSNSKHWKLDAVEPELLSAKENWRTQKSKVERFENTLPGAMIMDERQPARETFILNRGAYDSPGDKVERGTPAFLPQMPTKKAPYSRMDLAEWLISPKHPLTARVAVNRFWQQIFGVGLVKTSEDFGAQGEWPSHPKLLDYLATSFVESNWDVKKLMKMMVMSATYKQSSDSTIANILHDSENRLLARGSRYRLDAEVIRDQYLSHSGKLNPKMFGRAVFPPQPDGLWKSVSMSKANNRFIADVGDAIYRRSFYTFWRRGMPPPQMTIMNAPSREACVARRERTNTPLQSLLLMNEPEYFSMSSYCAQDILENYSDDTTRIVKLYETITTQLPHQQLIRDLSSALNDFKDYYQNNKNSAELMLQSVIPSNQENLVEVAAWTMIAHSLFNSEITKVRR